jgi:hypothetical protein
MRGREGAVVVVDAAEASVGTRGEWDGGLPETEARLSLSFMLPGVGGDEVEPVSGKFTQKKAVLEIVLLNWD